MRVPKKKAEPVLEIPVIAEVLPSALFLPDDKPKPTLKCTVCGSAGSLDHGDQLCWVCRRLKISAWRDVEQQMPAQE
jgi:hypothetical protein